MLVNNPVMKTAIHPLHVVVVVLYLLCMKASSIGSESVSKNANLMGCMEKEREALLLFKQSLVNETHLLDSWNKEQEEDCCKWKGVGCDYLTGHVTHLQLSSLISPLPIYLGSDIYSPVAPYRIYSNETRVSISRWLLDLPYLNYLDLSNNVLAAIPEFIGSLTKLVHLDFSDTWIEGSIPYQIGNLSNLQYLNLSYNSFYGPIPKCIGSLKRLRYLDLSNNYFSGVIPPELGNLSELQHLDLGYTFLTHLASGNFGWLFNKSSLAHLDLSGVNLTAPNILVSFIQRLPSISVLHLNYCNLSAPSSHLANFSSSISALHLFANHINSSFFNWISPLSGSLVDLDLGHNVLEGRIPQSVGHMTALTHLNLDNNLLSGPISQSFSNMTALFLLNLGNNLLNGAIPQFFGNMTALSYLILGNNSLDGPIPLSFGHMIALTHLELSQNQLNGILPKSIGNLSRLQVVDCSSNNFTGNLGDLLSGSFPVLRELWVHENQLTGSLPDITILPSLRYLEVRYNQLNGYLPKVFEHQSALQFLDLSNNHLRGSLPDFTGFSSLKSLYLDNNELCGFLPNFTGLSSLVVLLLYNNEFSGSLPDFTGCSSLQELRLDENRLTEWGAQSTGSLSSLITLDLSKNFIRSTISEAHLSSLSSLMYLSTSHNSLTFEFSSDWLPPFQLWRLSLASCKLGPKFPNWIRNQGKIGHLDISNSQISDTIPIWFGNFSTNLMLLNLSSNKIRGKFSWNYAHIQEIDLSSNNFIGSLPSIPAKCSKLNLSQNKFSGTLISLFVVEHLPLTFLDISHNQLYGALPDNWTYFRGLVFLNLGHNNFSGRIPMSVGLLVSLQTLILRNNKFNGELPGSLRNCTSIGFVDFGLNNLSGVVPAWIGEDLPQLYALILKSNRFNGSMPSAICHLSNLHFLDLSMNKISGSVPQCFENITSMIKKGTEVAEHTYSSNDLSAPPSRYSYFDDVLARWKGQEFEYGRNFAYLKMIDLSTNELTGEIPLGITRLLDLKGLNLSRNRFDGKVPAEIGHLKVLECLDLSTNKFSGEIPQSMSGLNFLAYLDVSNNNFSGRIPSGTQLQGFDIWTYEGNSGLCGKPLTKTCPGDEPDDDTHSSSGKYQVDGDDSIYEWWLYISATLGFSTSFWGFIGTLVLNRRWRHAYFLFLYNLKERFYVAMAVRIARLKQRLYLTG
ncbi:receptor-like protein EIX2 [Apium graveolens]|uniref:receptor-like protein EIX2 n=1 Tax=Apium graveolens TaxID=4045 RepID=UPI003D79B5F8